MEYSNLDDELLPFASDIEIIDDKFDFININKLNVDDLLKFCNSNHHPLQLEYAKCLYEYRMEIYKGYDVNKIEYDNKLNDLYDHLPTYLKW